MSALRKRRLTHSGGLEEGLRTGVGPMVMTCLLQGRRKQPFISCSKSRATDPSFPSMSPHDLPEPWLQSLQPSLAPSDPGPLNPIPAQGGRAAPVGAPLPRAHAHGFCNAWILPVQKTR